MANIIMIDKPIFLVDADWWARFGTTVQGKVNPDEKGDYEEDEGCINYETQL